MYKEQLERLSAIREPLLGWYGEHARILPWREDPSPYGVWVSEIMLQQTRVEAVKPYYLRFLEEFPDVDALAAADEQRLLKLWEGLGYYNRAKNLRKAARIIVSEYGGRIPGTCEELRKLPGIGRYTAAAIASIAYGKPEPVVDGNVLRVVSRIVASREDIRKQTVKREFEEALRETMASEEPGAYNQAMMEVGALVCVPNGQPRCGECPLAAFCLTREQGLWETVPRKGTKKARRTEERTILLIEAGDRIALSRRPDEGLLASLYEFPNLEGNYKAEEILAMFRAKSQTADAQTADARTADAQTADDQTTDARTADAQTTDARTADAQTEDGECSCQVEPVGEAKHIFSHVEWHMTGYRVRVNEIPGEYLAVEKRLLDDRYPIPGAFGAYKRLITADAGAGEGPRV